MNDEEAQTKGRGPAIHTTSSDVGQDSIDVVTAAVTHETSAYLTERALSCTSPF